MIQTRAAVKDHQGDAGPDALAVELCPVDEAHTVHDEG